MGIIKSCGVCLNRNSSSLTMNHEAVDLAPGYDRITRASKDAIISIIIARDVEISNA